METAINHDYINSYAEAYTNRIVDRYFSENSIIDGENILSITEFRQINLFIVKNIMVKWEMEAKKLRSPFFDYTSQEVQNALQDFMNVLSKNISIEQKVFKPLLKMAVNEVLILIFSPYDFFRKELLNIGTPVSLDELEKRKKFIKINSELYHAYVQKIEMAGVDNMQIKEAKEYFDEVCEEINFSPEEPDEYISLFSNEIQFDLKKVYAEVADESDKMKDDSEKKDDETEKKEDTGEKIEDETDQNADPGIDPGIDQGSNPGEEKVPIHEKYFQKKATLVDELKKEPASTVLDFHQKQKIDSIKKNISIQQRFRFVRELFSENDELFSEIIEYLDNCSSIEEANSYLNEKFLANGQWNNENDSVIEFLSVVSKKFPD
jgi:hypothetical protein